MTTTNYRDSPTAVIPTADVQAVADMPNAAERAAAMAALLEGKCEALATDTWSTLADMLQCQALGDCDEVDLDG